MEGDAEVEGNAEVEGDAEAVEREADVERREVEMVCGSVRASSASGTRRCLQQSR